MSDTRWIRSISDVDWLDMKVVATKQGKSIGDYLTFLHDRYKDELNEEYQANTRPS